MSDILSKEEIDALFADYDDEDDTIDVDENEDTRPQAPSVFTVEQENVLGEIGNIFIDTSTTALFAMLGQEVAISAQQISVIKWEDVPKSYYRPCVGVLVKYADSLHGTNVFLMKSRDAKIIASLLMGKDGEIVGEVVSKADLSAISEAAAQIISSAFVPLMSLIKEKNEMKPPITFEMDLKAKEMPESLDFGDEYAVCVQFVMRIGSLIDSKIMQLLPLRFAKKLSERVMTFVAEPESQVNHEKREKHEKIRKPKKVEKAERPIVHEVPIEEEVVEAAPLIAETPVIPKQPKPQARAKALQLQSFDANEDNAYQNENIDIIMDVPLELTVELGRTGKKIKEILELVPGSIVELDKLTNEPVDVLVNGKFVAKGEIVVVDDNLGIRVTEIVGTENRI